MSLKLIKIRVVSESQFIIEKNSSEKTCPKEELVKIKKK